MRSVLLSALVLLLLISGCERRDDLWLVLVQGVAGEGEGALRVAAVRHGEKREELRLPPSGFLPKGETLSGKIRLSPGDELRLELEGPGAPAALAAVCRPGAGGPAGWRLLYGPCLPGWLPAQFKCVVGSGEWDEFVSLCSAPRKPLPPDFFNDRGVAPGDTRERVAGLLGVPAKRGWSFPEERNIECWEYPGLDVYFDATSGRVLSLGPKGGHGGVGYGEAYSALVQKWGWPDRVVPSPHGEGWFVAVYDRPQGKVYWVVGENRVESAWLGEFLAD
jgi:hypothetical protein